MAVKSITKMSLFLSLMCILSLVRLNIFEIPVTLQSLGIFLSACKLKPKETFFTIFTYLFMGFLGLPVFAGGVGSYMYFLSPSGGFLIGFLFGGVIISYFISKKVNIIISMILGNFVIYFCGLLWFSFSLKLTFLSSFKLSIMPFIFIDIFKILFTYFVIERLGKINV